jgi:hypothetical protein
VGGRRRKRGVQGRKRGRDRKSEERSLGRHTHKYKLFVPNLSE